MPKATTKLNPRESLKTEPPAELRLNERETEIYQELAGRLQTEGFAGQADCRLIAITACAVCVVERLQEQVNALDTLTVTGSTRQVKCHPLISELRNERTKLGDLFDKLLLSPKSRSTSRLSEKAMRNGTYGLEPDSPLLKFLD